MKKIREFLPCRVRIPEALMEFSIFPAWVACISLLFLLNNSSVVAALSNDSEYNIIQKAFSLVEGFRITDLCSNASSCEAIKSLELPSRNLRGLVDLRGLSRLNRLQTINLSNNSLIGNIPDDLWTMQSLRTLNLGMNKYGGSLRFNWSKQGRVRYSVLQNLNLSSNRLETYENTLDLSGFANLSVIDLSHNRINGSKVLAQLFTLTNLNHISVAGNSLDSIPPVHNLTSLRHLDLSGNNLSGSILPLARITSLHYLDLSNNNLSGIFPDYFPSLQNLQFLNVSFNNFTGRLNSENIKKFGRLAFLHSGICNSTLKVGCLADSKPSSLTSPSPSPSIRRHLPLAPVGTSGSHSVVHHSYPSGRIKATIAGALSSGAVFVGAVALVLFCYCRSRRSRKNKWVIPKAQFPLQIDRSVLESGPFSFETESCTWVADIKDSGSAPVIIFEKPLLNLTFSDLLASTSHFSKESQLADEQSGPVYRAIIPGEIHVAIKVLEQAKDMDKDEAVSKLDALGRLKHPNLLPLLGYCIAGKGKLLLYEFMQNGDLYQWLHELPGGQLDTDDWSMDTWEQQGEGIPVSGERMGWITRHKIALGIARALAFLHHGSSPPIIHGCLNSYNVLLDDHFEPRVANCGINDLVKTSHPASSNLACTAPESSQTVYDCTKEDVYCFGVVLLELVTGKKASDDRFPDGFRGDLVAWVRFLMKEKQGDSALDSRLADAGSETQMLEALRVGYLCTAELPSKRPTMQQVVGLLKDIRPE